MLDTKEYIEHDCVYKTSTAKIQAGFSEMYFGNKKFNKKDDGDYQKSQGSYYPQGKFTAEDSGVLAVFFFFKQVVIIQVFAL